MNTIIDLPALKRLCLAIVHRALKDKDLEFFKSEYAEEICSTVNLNRDAIGERISKGQKSKGSTENLIRKYEKKPALVQARFRKEEKRNGKRKSG